MDNQELRELRDRLIKVETNHENLRDSHNVTKSEFGQFKKEMLDKFDELSTDVNSVKMTIAKYLGGFAVILFVGEFALKFLLK